MFSPLRTNPFPIRAAIQLGCDNLVSGTTARIDAAMGAIREASGGMGGNGLHAEVPISQPRVILRSENSSDENAFLDESSIAEATNALRQVVTRVKTQKPSEISLLLMPPFDRVANTPILREMWQREFQIKIHLFRDIDFKKQAYLHMLKCRRNDQDLLEFDDDDNGNNENQKTDLNNFGKKQKNRSLLAQTNLREQKETSKLRAIQRRRMIDRELKRNKASSSSGSNDEIDLFDEFKNDPLSPIQTAENFEWCWFMSHVVAAKNMAPHRMLLIKENAQFALDPEQNNNLDEKSSNNASSPASLEILGCDFGMNTSSLLTSASTKNEKIKLLKWSLPSSTFSIPQAHRFMYEKIQKRPIHAYKGHLKHSLNPMTRSEILQLTQYLAGLNLSSSSSSKSLSGGGSTPNWILNRLKQDGVVCGSSSNGGLLNTCARITGSVNISLEKLEQSTEFHYAGLSDALLKQNYPYPSLVCVQGAVMSVLCRYLLSTKNAKMKEGESNAPMDRVMCRRVVYLPEVSVTHAMLTHPDMWVMSSNENIGMSMTNKMRANIAPSQEEFKYPKQAIGKFDPNRMRY